MCRGSSVAVLSLRTLVAAALLIGKCEGGTCNRSTANNCSADKDCVPTIGPTQCVDNQCFCQEGFCWAKSDNDAADSTKDGTQMRCRASVGSCDILGCGSKKGPHAVECIEGECLCHSGYHADSNGQCQFGWWPPHALMILRNGTEAYGNLQSLSLRWQQAWQPSMQASMLPAYALVLCSTLTFAASVALQRHRRGSAVSVTSATASAEQSASVDSIEEACYEPLASAPLSLGGDGCTDNIRASSGLR